jgi:hypothetical protein
VHHISRIGSLVYIFTLCPPLALPLSPTSSGLVFRLDLLGFFLRLFRSPLPLPAPHIPPHTYTLPTSPSRLTRPYQVCLAPGLVLRLDLPRLLLGLFRRHGGLDGVRLRLRGGLGGPQQLLRRPGQLLAQRRAPGLQLLLLQGLPPARCRRGEGVKG